MIAAVIILSVLLVAALLLVGGLKLQLDKSVALLAKANAINQRLATECIRQGISTNLNRPGNE